MAHSAMYDEYEIEGDDEYQMERLLKVSIKENA